MPLDDFDSWLSEILKLVRASSLEELRDWKKKTEDELSLRLRMRGGEESAVSYHDEDAPITLLRSGLQILEAEIERRVGRKRKVSGAFQQQTPLQAPELDKKRLRVKVDGVWYELTQKQTDMLAVLFEAKGDWTGGKEIGVRPDKIIAAMPKPAAALIETHRTKGYRITRLLP